MQRCTQTFIFGIIHGSRAVKYALHDLVISLMRIDMPTESYEEVESAIISENTCVHEPLKTTSSQNP